MAALISLATAKIHLRIDTAPGDPGDADLTLKLNQASAIVLAYMNRGVLAGWTDAEPPSVPVPGPVEAMTLLVLSDLYEHRDVLTPSAETWAVVERTLKATGFRGPVLA